MLEYAAILVNYAAAYHFYHINPDPSDPFPMVLFYADNTASESWMEKACNSSLIGRALSRLQCAMMMNNNVGIRTAHITTNKNVIADHISRIKRKTNSIQHTSYVISLLSYRIIQRSLDASVFNQVLR